MDRLRAQFTEQLRAAKTVDELEELRVQYLGRNGLVNDAFKEMINLPKDERKQRGKDLNLLKRDIESLLEKKKQDLIASSANYDDLDVTLPGKPVAFGQLHPHTILRRQMNAIFQQLGFSVYEGPHIETDEYVFERANLPKHHPARSLQDTILIEDPDILLRSHTSSVENRALENEKLPLRIVTPGMTFRYETPNQTNHFLFYQYQGVAVATDITMADLKGTFETVFRFIFGEQTVTRFRAKYYPEVEPGCGIDIRCFFCDGEGCPSCKRRGWVEVGGSGMIHPNMLGAAGIDGSVYSGFAFGLGFDRIVMQRLQIDDIRKIYDGTLV
jgi:phenylalanyl-tRNA synthetase alpha chain